MNSKARYARAESALFAAFEANKEDTLDSYQNWLESLMHEVEGKLSKAPASTWESPEIEELTLHSSVLRASHASLLAFKHRRLNGPV